MQGLCSIFAHLWGPVKAGVRQPILILSPCWGPPRMQGLCSLSAHFWAPEKAGLSYGGGLSDTAIEVHREASNRAEASRRASRHHKEESLSGKRFV